VNINSNLTDFIGTLSSESNTGTFDTTNKKFGTASIAYNGSQYTQYADNNIFNFGSDDWWVGCYIKKNALAK
jgi:hypothetical protein